MTATILPFQRPPKLARGERPKRARHLSGCAYFDLGPCTCGRDQPRTDADRLADMDRNEMEAVRAQLARYASEDGVGITDAIDTVDVVSFAKSGGPQVSTAELADYLQTKEAWDGEPKVIA